MHIKVKDHNGRQHIVEFRTGDNLLDVLDDNNIRVRTDCGGMCACVTCHVYISYPHNETIKAPDSDETIMLTQVDGGKSSSRLACEVILNEGCDGMVIDLAPGSELDE